MVSLFAHKSVSLIFKHCPKYPFFFFSFLFRASILILSMFLRWTNLFCDSPLMLSKRV
ncbi:hypothetical protein SLEP1_g41351 [Rubroshorea leprosula]|uniref:Uncharacterized protein n=1 Tax=Rubroshorea leprosula TaxID=152421 RepID=A0AAV5L781_9ROSI|nr:hypothetical protein SLEP1_g41351 [Rubroshorea leprosula]